MFAAECIHADDIPVTDSNRRADQVNLSAFDGRGALPGCDAAFPELMESLESMMVS
jgi:hypothetical protein